MTYSSFNSSTVYLTTSGDGWNWDVLQEIRDQGFDVSTLAVVENVLVMVYPTTRSSDNDRLLQSVHTTSGGWETPEKIDGQQARNVAITFCLGWLIMAYSDNHSSQFCASRSLGGRGWGDTQQIRGRNGSVPALTTFKDMVYMIYAGTESSGQLHVTRLNADLEPFTWT
eukprot:SM000003S11232  [mRNA]  locus=s3:1731320:1731826:- [translate_table: standard]